MTSRFIKVPALQGVSSIDNNQILDFDLLNYGYIDPQRSYISVNADIATTEADVTSGVGVHCVYMPMETGDADPGAFKNSFLIGDYELRSSSCGVLESVLDSNVINANFDYFNRDFEQVLSDNYKTIAQYVDPTADAFIRQDASPFRTLLQSAPSQEITHQMKIKLPDISPMLKQIPIYDCEAMGNTRLRIKWDTTALDPTGPNEYLPYSTMYSIIPCNSIAGTGASNDVVITQKVIDANDLELAQNDTVLVVYTTGGNQIVAERTVTAIGGAGQAATVTINGAAIPASASSVQIVKRLDGSGVDCAQPGTNAYVNLNDKAYTQLDVVNARKKYFGNYVAISYPVSATSSGFINRQITGVDVVNGVLQLSFNTAITTAGTDAGTVYLIPTPAFTFDAVDVTGTIYTKNGTTVQAVNLWVGQKVRITALTGAPAKQAVTTVITAINQVGNNVAITVATAMANSTTGFRLQCVAADSLSLTFSNPTLVMKTLNAGNKKLAKYLQNESKQVMFSSYSIERANILANQASFNRIFDCEPGCSNAFFFLVSRVPAQAGVRDLLAIPNNLKSYRMRLNDIMVTNREVVPFSALYYDGVVQALQNSNLASLRNLGYTAQNQVLMPCAILPNSNELNRLLVSIDFDMTANPATPELVVYCVKEKVHMLAIGKGGVKFA